MPDSRRHRGPHPADEILFADPNLPDLRSATSDFCWLLDHGYAVVSSIKLVGDRYALRERQRTAVKRASCSGSAFENRRAKQVPIAGLPSIWIDGFNLLTTVEAAMAGGVVLTGRDRCYRDMASMHGTYRQVEETIPALNKIGTHLEANRVDKAHWLLDQPVSNSGRLATILREVAEAKNWDWTVELVRDPDPVLKQLRDSVVVSADSEILNECSQWANVAKLVVDELEGSRIVDLYPHSDNKKIHD